MKAGRLPVLQRLYLADELDETAAKVVTGRKDAHIQPMGKSMKFIAAFCLLLTLAACGGPQNARFNDDIWHSGAVFGGHPGSSSGGD